MWSGCITCSSTSQDTAPFWLRHRHWQRYENAVDKENSEHRASDERWESSAYFIRRCFCHRVQTIRILAVERERCLWQCQSRNPKLTLPIIAIECARSVSINMPQQNLNKYSAMRSEGKARESITNRQVWRAKFAQNFDKGNTESNLWNCNAPKRMWCGVWSVWMWRVSLSVARRCDERKCEKLKMDISFLWNTILISITNFAVRRTRAKNISNWKLCSSDVRNSLSGKNRNAFMKHEWWHNE